MSTLKTNKAQFGQSGTATQNFTLTAEAADGTMKLARGNAGSTTQDILTVDAAGLVTFNQGKQLTLGTAKPTTSGTSIDFSPSDGTGIPSWVKRITVMLDSVSTNGASTPQIQIGSGSIAVTGYVSAGVNLFNTGTVQGVNSTAGIVLTGSTLNTSVQSGSVVFTLLGTNTWIASGCGGTGSSGAVWSCGGTKTLSGTLDRIRLTTVNGTDTFDSGSVNIMYEG